MSRRVATTAGVVAAGGIGYYLYVSGGDTSKAKASAQRTICHRTLEVLI